MEALLLAPSTEPQNPITDPANSKANYQSDDKRKDETMKKKKKKKKETNPSNLEKRKLKGKKKEIMNNDEASSSSCSASSTSNPNYSKRVTRVVHRLRNPTVRLGMARRSVGERQAEALAKPLGFSFAALANLVRSISKLLSPFLYLYCITWLFWYEIGFAVTGCFSFVPVVDLAWILGLMC